MNRIHQMLLGAACLSTAFSPGVSAQQIETPEQSGTAAAEQLLIPVTARSAALGGSFTGGINTLSGLEALQVNPAALTLNQGTSGLFSRMEYVADIGVNHFGIAHRVGNSNLALSITSWDFGDIEETFVSNPTPDVASTYEASNVLVGLTYARNFTDRISAGVTSKLGNEKIDDMSSTYVAFDAGMTYVVGESGLRFGVSLRNFGPQLAFGGNGLSRPATVGDGSDVTVAGDISAASHELPSLLNFGATYTRDFAQGLSASILGNFRSNSTSPDQYSGALELGYQNIIFVRGGFELRSDMDLTFYEGWNIGGGVNYNLAGVQMAVDYAYRPVQYFDGVNLFTASVTL